MTVKRLLLFAVVILTSSIGISYAQDSNPLDLWASVWLYDSDAVKINVLSTQGTPVLREFFPKLTPEYDVMPQEIALSPDGVSVAFALSSSTTGKEALFELSRSENGPKVVEIPGNAHLSPRIVFHNTAAIQAASTEAYDPIFGMTIWLQMTVGPDPTLAFADTSVDDFWTIAIYDPSTDKITHKLTRKQALNLGPKLDWPASASIILQAYNDDTVIFSLIDKQSGKLASFSWNTVAKQIRPNVAYRAKPADLDSLPSTGEVVAADGDTLYVYDPKVDESFAFYRSPGEILRLPRFVENGKRIAVVANGTIRIMNRDGSQVVMAGPPAESVIDMAGVPAGLVFLSAFDEITVLANLGFVDEDSFSSHAVLWSTPKRVSAHIALTQSGMVAPSSFDTQWAKLDSSSAAHK